VDLARDSRQFPFRPETRQSFPVTRQIRRRREPNRLSHLRGHSDRAEQVQLPRHDDRRGQLPTDRPDPTGGSDSLDAAAPVIKDTRLLASAIARRIDAGDTFEMLERERPDVPAEAFEAA
jgi:hypothetical protein